MKPNFEGSSKGVTQRSIVDDHAALDAIVTEWVERYPAGVIIEEFILGRDVTVPWLEPVGVLTPAADRFGAGPHDPRSIYDYALKNELSDPVHVEVLSLVAEILAPAVRRLAAARAAGAGR